MNEHDKFFKEIQSVRDNALDFIRGTVPAELLSQMNLDTLCLEKDSFIDTELKEHFSDLIYSCQTANRQKLKLTLLLEHKSQKPANEHLQILRYLLNIWEYEAKNRLPFSVIIPIIFYHGDTSWKARLFTERFADYAPALLRFVPPLPYLLTDLQRYDDEAIKRTLFQRDINATMALLMKYIRNTALLQDKLAEIFIPIRERFASTSIPTEVSSIFFYLLKLSELDIDTIRQIISTIDPKGGDAIMTTAAKLHEAGKIEGIREGKIEGIREGKIEGIREGKIEGIREGKIEAQVEAARRMLDKGSDLPFIAEITGLSHSQIKALRNKKD